MPARQIASEGGFSSDDRVVTGIGLSILLAGLPQLAGSNRKRE